MARFKNSNRIAAEQMSQTSDRAQRTPPKPEIEQPYFRRIGFDFAMI